MLPTINIWFTITKKLSVTISFYSGEYISGKIMLNFVFFTTGLGLDLELYYLRSRLYDVPDENHL